MFNTLVSYPIQFLYENELSNMCSIRLFYPTNFLYIQCFIQLSNTFSIEHMLCYIFSIIKCVIQSIFDTNFTYQNVLSTTFSLKICVVLHIFYTNMFFAIYFLNDNVLSNSFTEHKYVIQHIFFTKTFYLTHSVY